MYEAIVLQEIRREIHKVYELTWEEVTSKSKRRRVCEAKRAAARALRDKGWSLSEIAAALKIYDGSGVLQLLNYRKRSRRKRDLVAGAAGPGDSTSPALEEQRGG